MGVLFLFSGKMQVHTHCRAKMSYFIFYNAAVIFCMKPEMLKPLLLIGIGLFKSLATSKYQNEILQNGWALGVKVL